MPPFGKGFEGENIEYDSEKLCPNTDRIVERYVVMSIGPQYTEADVEDMVKAIEKVDINLYGKKY
jgi:dTDP-4-amino-4,6-dideoxygalactose transaminase